jgi:hypothetical protein
MMRLLVLSMALSQTIAFTAPAQRRGARTKPLSMAYETEVGAQRPLGFWDPLQLVTNADQERFDKLRFTEIKHGRISMLAVVGYLIGASDVRWGGYADLAKTIKFEDVPGGFQSFEVLPSGYFFWLVALLGGVDFHLARDYSNEEDFPSNWTPEFPGDIRNEARHLPDNAQSGVLQMWENLTPEEKLSKRAIELNNGRAAMMGILALMVHEQLGNLDVLLPLGAPGLGYEGPGLFGN